MCMIKRRGDIVSAYTISAIIVLSIGYPLIFFVSYMDIVTEKNNRVLWTVLEILNELCFNPFYFITALSILCRYWLIYYDLQFNHSCSNLKWKECISSNINDLKKDKWFIGHRETYGNTSYLMKRLFIIVGIISSLSMTSAWLYEQKVVKFPLWHLVNVPVFMFMIGMMLKLASTMPSFYDNLYLYQEARLIVIFWIGGFVVYTTSVVVEMAIGRTIASYFIISLMGTINIFWTPFISTYWVMKKLPEGDYENDCKMRRAMSLSSGSRTRAGSKASEITGTGIGSESLQGMLQKEDTLNLYMSHLIKEFCMEGLLALIEFTQFKMNLFTECDDINEGTIGDLLVFPLSVPRSDIVFGSEKECGDEETASEEDKLRKFKIMARRLYVKYIKIGSEFQLNVSYMTRGTLDHLMASNSRWLSEDSKIKSVKDLVKIFDISINEITVLLDGRRHRFEYETV